MLLLNIFPFNAWPAGTLSLHALHFDPTAAGMRCRYEVEAVHYVEDMPQVGHSSGVYRREHLMREAFPDAGAAWVVPMGMQAG